MPAAAFGLLLLQACSGPAAPTPPTVASATPIVLPGIEGSGIVSARVRGAIDRFGSVYVGGVRYSTATALMLRDAAAVDESQLRVGQIVTLDVRRAEDGSIAEALRVEQVTAVIGCIDAVDPVARRLLVAGQTVTTDAATLFGAGLEGGFDGGLAEGAAVAVSGLPDVGAALRATRIDAHPGCGIVQVTGRPRMVDAVRGRLTIGAQSIDYSATQWLEIDPRQLTDGSAIVVTGSLRDEVLIASTLRRDVALAWEQGPIEIEAPVTAIENGDRLVLGATRIALAAATRVEGDRPVPGDVVRVAARVVDGELVAESVQRVDAPLHRLHGPISTVGADGSVEIAGFVVTVDARTRFHDAADARFSLAQLAPGQVVSVRGTPGPAPGVLHASVIVRVGPARDDDDDDDDDDEARGARGEESDAWPAAGERILIRSLVDGVGPGGLSLLGRTVTIDDDTDFDDVARQELPGQFVFVVAHYRAGELVAREVQADGSDDLDD